MQLCQTVDKLDPRYWALFPLSHTYSIFFRTTLIASNEIHIRAFSRIFNSDRIFEREATPLRTDAIPAHIRHDYGPHGAHLAAAVHDAGDAVFAAFVVAAGGTLPVDVVRFDRSYLRFHTVTVMRCSWPHFIYDLLRKLTRTYCLANNLNVNNRLCFPVFSYLREVF